MQRLKIICCAALIVLIAQNAIAAEFWAVVKGSITAYTPNIEITNIYSTGGAGFSGLSGPMNASYFAQDSERQLKEFKRGGEKCNSAYYAIDNFECTPVAYPNGATMAACSANIVCLNVLPRKTGP
jgi:phage terminase large subunit-like protein